MIEIENVTVRSGAFTLTNVTAAIAEGEYAVLMGGTGQGKTTILEAVCEIVYLLSEEVKNFQRNIRLLGQ